MNTIKKRLKKMELLNREWYSLRSLLGNDWALFFLILGAREAGKSYAVTDFYVKQFMQLGRPFYWMRLTDASKKKLLNNNAEKLIDPDIRRKWNLELETNGDSVYQVVRGIDEKIKKDGSKELIETKSLKLMARVLDLSTFYNDKGSGLFDKDFLNDPNMYYNICLDEMNREKNERKSFDIVYAFCNQLENLVRSTKKRIRVICIGNTLEEASDILCSFNFIPNDYGRFKLRKKRCVIDYIAPSEKYLNRRKGTISDILLPSASTFTNKIETDTALIHSGRVHKAHAIIKFSKDKDKWFTVYDDDVICRYNKEHVQTIAMRPYLDDLFNRELQLSILARFDARGFKYKDLITFKTFQKELELLKPRKS